jgi:hypothetical protein
MAFCIRVTWFLDTSSFALSWRRFQWRLARFDGPEKINVKHGMIGLSLRRSSLDELAISCEDRAVTLVVPAHLSFLNASI